MNGYEERFAAVHRRIEIAASSVGRDPASVQLIAVSKFQPVEAIQALYDLGHRAFGESRLQEALPKMAVLPSDIEWHFIGKLQPNKARRAAEAFDVIHTLESEGQLSEIAKSTKSVRAFVEVNIAEEEQKSGIFPNLLDDFVKKAIHCLQVQFFGLMTIGPALENPEAMRPYFAQLRSLNEKVGGGFLSMGMSDSFDWAIMDGSTHVRVGTALFGARVN